MHVPLQIRSGSNHLGTHARCCFEDAECVPVAEGCFFGNRQTHGVRITIPNIFTQPFPCNLLPASESHAPGRHV